MRGLQNSGLVNWIQNILVGLLFFGALALVGYFTIISESGPFAPRGEQMVLFFDTADGVKKGSAVTILGVPAGTVAAVDLVSVDVKNHPVESTSPDRIGQRVAISIDD